MHILSKASYRHTVARFDRKRVTARSPLPRTVSVCASDSKMDVGLIGLGIMGEPMAANLLSSGKFSSVTVWNRTQSKVGFLVLNLF